MDRDRRSGSGRLAVTAAAIALAALAGTAPAVLAQDEEPLKIAYLSFAIANSYDAPMLAAAKEAAAAGGAEIVEFDANNDPGRPDPAAPGCGHVGRVRRHPRPADLRGRARDARPGRDRRRRPRRQRRPDPRRGHDDERCPGRRPFGERRLRAQRDRAQDGRARRSRPAPTSTRARSATSTRSGRSRSTSRSARRSMRPSRRTRPSASSPEGIGMFNPRSGPDRRAGHALGPTGHRRRRRLGPGDHRRPARPSRPRRWTTRCRRSGTGAARSRSQDVAERRALRDRDADAGDRGTARGRAAHLGDPHRRARPGRRPGVRAAERGHRHAGDRGASSRRGVARLIHGG